MDSKNNGGTFVTRANGLVSPALSVHLPRSDARARLPNAQTRPTLDDFLCKKPCFKSFPWSSSVPRVDLAELGNGFKRNRRLGFSSFTNA